jgi:Mn-containing catalase
MWKYIKKLEYPVNIRNKDLKMAKNLLAQYGGPDGEFAASMRYFNQRFSMPDERGKALLTDISCEELSHVEMIAAMVMQLMKGASIEELDAAGLTANYVMHDHSLFPCNPNGVPFTAAYIETTGDFIADLVSDMAAEQRARAGYEHIMSLTSDPDLLGPLSFLRQREVVHYNRFKELKEYYEEKYYKKNIN